MTHGGLRIYETFDRHLKTIDYEGKDYKEHLFAQLTRMLIDGYDDDHLSDFARNYIYSIDVNLLL